MAVFLHTKQNITSYINLTILLVRVLESFHSLTKLFVKDSFSFLGHTQLNVLILFAENTCGAFAMLLTFFSKKWQCFMYNILKKILCFCGLKQVLAIVPQNKVKGRLRGAG